MSLRSTIRLIQAQDNDGKAISADKTAFISEWKSDLRNLYDIIAKELDEFVNDGLLAMDIFNGEAKEDTLGTYTVPMLRIKAGSRDIIGRPIARVTTGGAGRVDLMRADRTADGDRIYIVRRVLESGDLQWFIEEKKSDPLAQLQPFISALLQPRSYTELWRPSLEKAVDFLLKL